MVRVKVGCVGRELSLDPRRQGLGFSFGAYSSLWEEVGCSLAVVEEEHRWGFPDPVDPGPLELGIERSHPNPQSMVRERMLNGVFHVRISPPHPPRLETTR